MSEWISVKDKLPPHEEYILIYESYKEMTFEYYSLAYYDETKKKFFNASDASDETPTHWMPLPSSPNEENANDS